MKLVTTLAILPLLVSLAAPGFAENSGTDETDMDEEAEKTEMVEEVSYDAEAGEALYKKNCRACHGPTAKGVSSYPKLAGQPFDDLVDKLHRYRSGEKIGPNTMLMAPRAKKLSDDDINNIVAFITSLE